MGATLRFYICPLKSSLKHHHNKGFRRPSWADFHLALCVRESHLAFGVGAEGSKPSCLTMERQPSSVTHSHSQTSFMCKSFLDLLFTHCALRYLLNQVINVMAGLEICFILWKRIIRLIGALAFVERGRTNFMQLAGTITNFNFWRIIYFLLFYLTLQTNTYSAFSEGTTTVALLLQLSKLLPSKGYKWSILVWRMAVT